MTAYYNEIDPYCCRVLRKQIAAGNLPPGDVDERDIREVGGDDLRGYDQVHLFAGIGGFPLGLRMAGVPDDFPIWTGGFPCQDISNAGKRAGIGGERSGLWSEFHRLIRLVRPRYVLVENVAALLVRGMDRVLGDLATIGYDAEWNVLSASDFGAPHIRERVFLLAYTGRGQCHAGQDVGRILGQVIPEEALRPVSREVWMPGVPRRIGRLGRSLPDLPDDGMDDGLPDRLDRIRALGNAVVPQAVELIGRMILEATGGDCRNHCPTL